MPKKAKTTCEMKNSENTPNPVLRPRGDAESYESDTFHAILREWCQKCALKGAESCEEDTQEDQIHVKSSSVKKCALKDAESCEEYTQEDQIHVKSSRIT